MMISTMVWNRLQELFMEFHDTKQYVIVMSERTCDRMLTEFPHYKCSNEIKCTMFNFPFIKVKSDFDGFMIVRKLS